MWCLVEFFSPVMSTRVYSVDEANYFLYQNSIYFVIAYFL